MGHKEHPAAPWQHHWGCHQSLVCASCWCRAQSGSSVSLAPPHRHPDWSSLAQIAIAVWQLAVLSTPGAEDVVRRIGARIWY